MDSVRPHEPRRESQNFISDKRNLQKLKGWFQAAKQNGNVPTSDHETINKTIKIIDKKLE